MTAARVGNSTVVVFQKAQSLSIFADSVLTAVLADDTVDGICSHPCDANVGSRYRKIMC
jgi:hypothetical protein